MPRSDRPAQRTWFRFDKRKAAEAAASIVLMAEKARRPTAEYIWVIKILYFADRLSIQRYGRPICGGWYLAMDHGPVISEVLHRAKAEVEDPAWTALLSRKEEYSLALSGEFEPKALSERDLEILRECFKRFHKDSWWTIRNKSHRLPEWKQNRPPIGSRQGIPLEDLVESLKLSEAEAGFVLEAAQLDIRNQACRALAD